jgi:hypothetical protein
MQLAIVPVIAGRPRRVDRIMGAFADYRAAIASDMAIVKTLARQTRLH